MADDYVPKPYPKFLHEHGVVVQDAVEHEAVRRGTASIHVVKSAQGEQRTVVVASEERAAIERELKPRTADAPAPPAPDVNPAAARRRRRPR